jgi:hypothetical protein
VSNAWAMGLEPEPNLGGLADHALVDGNVVSDAQYAVTEDGYVLLSVPSGEIQAGFGFQHDCVIEHQGQRLGPFRGTERQVAGLAGRVARVFIRSNQPVPLEPLLED